ncbi:enoyl-ACP reductase [Legionella sp. W05-934-2]|jgi:enoyl-[acyl-carrier protein] reductase I|uniref:enoyl-ACP reductase FabI n=1 Tax=Legionella sp. W05-934-2 TaxID=1198649 RepID=UPI0034625916
MGFLQGKKALICGLASNRSIAYGIAKAFHEQGAELAFTYQNDKLKERVEKMAAEFGSSLVFPCDVASDDEINAVFSSLKQHWSHLDCLVHSVAYAPADQIGGNYLENATREGFRIAHDISAYSLVALAKAAYPMMQDCQASIIALSYYGAEKAVPNYNVMGIAKASLEAAVRYLALNMGEMGIRVNAISAGPIKTLAASGVKDFKKMLQSYEQMTPLRKNVSIEEVGQTAAFLCSNMASGITGEVLHVDAGFHAVAMSSVGE